MRHLALGQKPYCVPQLGPLKYFFLMTTMTMMMIGNDDNLQDDHDDWKLWQLKMQFWFCYFLY